MQVQWKRYYKKLLTDDSYWQIEIQQEDMKPVEEITTERKTTLKGTKNNKIPGHVGIPIELIKKYNFSKFFQIKNERYI